MTRHEIARLVCKTAALLIWTHAILYFSTALVSVFYFLRYENPLSFEPQRLEYALYYAIPLAGEVGMAFFFWTAADWLAARMVSRDPTPVGGAKISIQDVTVVVFSACGILLIALGLSDLGTFVAGLIYVGFLRDVIFTPDFCSVVIKTVFGVWLLIGSNGIVRFVHGVRTWGTRKNEDGEVEGGESAT